MPAIKARINRMIVPKNRFHTREFPMLRLLNRIHESKLRFGGVGVRICAWCEKWQPYMDDEKGKWYEPAELVRIKSIALKGVDLKASHGVCPPCFDREIAVIEPKLPEVED